MSKLKSEFKKAWLIRWNFQGLDEDGQLERLGIKNKVVSFFNTRKTFEVIEEYVKNLYIQQVLSFSEKAHLENYQDGEKNKKEMFGKSVPLFTSYQTHLYREMMQCGKEKGLENERYKILCEKWAAYPEHVLVGYNPSLEGKKVSNLRIFEENWTCLLEWDESFLDGSERREVYRVK